jgi:3-phenylpropionate/trans-cinnamate dioxygenase ferredoxin reductase component
VNSGTAYDVVIVGGGHGGAHAAINLRQAGYAGSVAILSAESEYPYDRPTLSKEYLTGQKSREQIRLRSEGFWQERKVDLIRGERAEFIDVAARKVATDAGREVQYGKLVWATGGEPRRVAVPGALQSNVLALRSLADADRLRACIDRNSRILIIGGGYIGLEAAAVLVKAGRTVTLIEALDRVLARATGPELSRHVEAVHRTQGVDLRLGTGVERFEGNGTVEAAVLSDGSRIPCDLVLVGIGIVPEVEVLRRAGAICGNGVEIDLSCRTSLEDVLAIGDCASHPNAFANGERVRLESVQNATDMARVAADVILGKPSEYRSVPWFWSNQYDLRIQTVGLWMGSDQRVVRGDPASGSFSVVYLKKGRVIAIDSVNATKDFVQGKVLVKSGAVVSRDRLADSAIALSSALGT